MAQALGEWMNENFLKGRVAFVTGAGSGIGEATARLFARVGCAVAVADIRMDQAARVVDDIKRSGGAALAIRFDVAKVDEVASAIHDTVEWKGKLDFVVNNAGAVLTGSLLDADLKEWATSFDVNVLGPLLVSRAAFPHLCKSDAAAIVTVASVAGGRAYPSGPGYGPSKAAAISLTRQLAMEWAEHGIRANIVSPGTVLTPLMMEKMSDAGRADRTAKIPLRRLAHADELAAVIVFLASPAASYVTGQEMPVDGGLTQSLMRQSFTAGAGRV